MSPIVKRGRRSDVALLRSLACPGDRCDKPPTPATEQLIVRPIPQHPPGGQRMLRALISVARMVQIRTRVPLRPTKQHLWPSLDGLRPEAAYVSYIRMGGPCPVRF